METIIALWLSKPWWDKVANLLILFGFVWMVGWALLQFIKGIKKSGTAISVGDDGVMIGTSDTELITKEQLSPMERKLFIMIEENNKSRNKETLELKTRIAELEKELNELSTQVQKREAEDALRKRMLIPFNQHAVFTNLKSIINHGIDLGETFPAEKKKVAKIFLEECKFPILYKRLLEFVIDIEQQPLDDGKSAMLFKLPDKLLEWTEEINLKAMDIEVVFGPSQHIMGIPRVFLTAFEEWDKPHKDATMRKIDQANTHAFYRTWQMRLIMMLDTLDTANIMAVEDVKKTLRVLNGHLDKEINDKISRCN